MPVIEFRLRSGLLSGLRPVVARALAMVLLAAGFFTSLSVFLPPAGAASLDQEVDQFFSRFSPRAKKVRHRDRKRRQNGVVLEKLKDRRGRNAGVIAIGGGTDLTDPSRRDEYRSKYYSGGHEPGYEPGIIKFRIHF